ncbi:MAG: sulfite exporter TauE/SafE family protein [Pseudomonadota bacterium]
MDLSFPELTLVSALLLFVVGFIGGMVSGFIGSGGAFMLTPAMMSLGAPAIVAVASNMAHKFPKALVGAIKRAKFGQVDVKLGIVMGLFAEVGVFAGKELMTLIRRTWGDIGTDLYVSLVFVVVLAIVGGLVLRDAMHARRRHAAGQTAATPRLARWVQSVHIPGTMMRFSSIGNREVSLLFVAPLGFATGMLAASIAVGGFIGVPAMIYVLGVPALMASATELVVAFVMGLGGSLLYAWDGFVDIRMAMIILAGSLFGVQIGAIATTYVREGTVKIVMGMIMVIVLVSRLFKLPVYLADLGMIEALGGTTVNWLDALSFGTLALALIAGSGTILAALFKGMAEHRERHAVLEESAITD